MAYTIVNGPKVLTCEARSKFHAVLTLTYDDIDASKETVELYFGDVVRIKYMTGAYNSSLKEVQGRITRFGVVRANAHIISEPVVNVLEIDASTVHDKHIAKVLTAAIREIEIIKRANEPEKPDCSVPGADCPNNPCCLCPGHVERPVEPPTCDNCGEVIPPPPGFKDPFEDARNRGIIAMIGSKEYINLQDALDEVTPGGDIIVIGNVLEKDETLECEHDHTFRKYNVCKHCTIKGYKPYTTFYGSFLCDTTDTVKFENLKIIHTGTDIGARGIEAMNASISVSHCIFDLAEGIDIEDVHEARAIVVSRLNTDRAYTPVSIVDVKVGRYGGEPKDDYIYSSIFLLRNKNIYGDFECEVRGLDLYEDGNNKDTLKFASLVFINADFADATSEDSVEFAKSSGVVCDLQALQYLLSHGQGPIGIVGRLDTDNDASTQITIPEGVEVHNHGLINLSNFSVAVNGSLVLFDKSTLIGGTLTGDIKNIHIDSEAEEVYIYHCKHRSGGSQKTIKPEDILSK